MENIPQRSVYKIDYTLPTISKYQDSVIHGDMNFNIPKSLSIRPDAGFFENYRSERLNGIMVPGYQPSLSLSPYNPRPEMFMEYEKRNWKRVLALGNTVKPLLNETRFDEYIDDFYNLFQRQRTYYKDVNKSSPLSYFMKTDYTNFVDPSMEFMNKPESYTLFNLPSYSLSFERSRTLPPIVNRSLAGNLYVEEYRKTSFNKI